ncbi:SRPBCC family protein [Nocardia sp. NBC_01730]|uniref:SRPBCC family protein n=1 Tax=Nocardia sp. NBC_01730 TaxID=2975998 RepID=UPI003FA3A6EA
MYDLDHVNEHDRHRNMCRLRTLQDGMATFENTLTVDRPIADVFAYLAHFENVPRWNYAITETRRTSAGPVGGGFDLPADPIDSRTSCGSVRGRRVPAHATVADPWPVGPVPGCSQPRSPPTTTRDTLMRYPGACAAHGSTTSAPNRGSGFRTQ